MVERYLHSPTCFPWTTLPFTFPIFHFYINVDRICTSITRCLNYIYIFLHKIGAAGCPVKGTVYRFVELCGKEVRELVTHSRLLTCQLVIGKVGRKVCCMLLASCSRIFHNFLHVGIWDVFIASEISFRHGEFSSVCLQAMPYPIYPITDFRL